MKKSKINKVFIPFIVVFFLIATAYFLYYGIEFGYEGEHEKIFFFIFSIFFSAFVGAMVFLPSHFEFIKYNEYSLLTAVSNYLLMLFESSSMMLGLYMLGNEDVALSKYLPIFYLIIYLFFGMHLFSYPRTFRSSFTALLINILYILSNLVASENYISATVNQFAKIGYVFTLSLIVAGFLMFFKPFLYLYKSNEKSTKILLFIYSSLYLIFIFIPGLLYYLPGLTNYFVTETSTSLIINIFYFGYILYTNIKRMTAELINFISVK